MKKEWIYFKEKDGTCYAGLLNSPSNPWRTEAVVLADIARRGGEIISKAEYNTFIAGKAYDRLKARFDNDDIGGIFDQLQPSGNVFSFLAFEQITGITLDKAWKRRRLQLIEYFGDKYTAWQEEEQRKAEEEEQQRIAERQKRRAQQAENAEQRYKAGNWISGEDFLLLCDSYRVEMHPRTRGYCKQKVREVNQKHSIRIPQGTKYSQGFAETLWKLDRALAIA